MSHFHCFLFDLILPHEGTIILHCYPKEGNNKTLNFEPHVCMYVRVRTSKARGWHIADTHTHTQEQCFQRLVWGSLRLAPIIFPDLVVIFSFFNASTIMLGQVKLIISLSSPPAPKFSCALTCFIHEYH